MKKFSKGIILSSTFLLFTGCAYPFQSNKYPAWTTKGILESYTLSDGRSIDGWVGANIGDVINTKWFKFTVNFIDEVDSYKNYKPENNKKLIHAQIKITNNSQEDINILDEDFALVWNLNKEERTYVYPKEYSIDANSYKEITIGVNETKIVDIIYEIDNNTEKPWALYYNEQYNDGQKGNKYYIYLR